MRSEVLHQHAGARARCARDLPDVAHRLLGIPAEELGRIGDLGAGIRKRLAVFERHQSREALGLLQDQLEGLAQDLAALARLARGPAGERGACGIDGGLGVLRAGARHRGDLGFGRRIDDVEAVLVGCRTPFAADVEVGRNVREKIVVHGKRSWIWRFLFTRHPGHASAASAPGSMNTNQALRHAK